jgi:hypothetical protein
MAAGTPLKTMVRLGKIRWRVEHDYREMKTGLGLDHFEGRSFVGWHRHVTLVVLAQAFCTPVAPGSGTGPKSGCAGLTLYPVLREWRPLLAVMTGACHTCQRPFPTPANRS